MHYTSLYNGLNMKIGGKQNSNQKFKTKSKKGSFSPGSSHDPGLKASFARVFWAAAKRLFSPGSWLDPGLKNPL